MKLIDKAGVMAEIERLLDKETYHEEYNCAYRDGNNGALYALRDKLNAHEVKDVGCEREIGFYTTKELLKKSFITKILCIRIINHIRILRLVLCRNKISCALIIR